MRILMTMTRIRVKIMTVEIVDERHQDEIYVKNIHAQRTKIPQGFSSKMSTESS